METLKRIGLLLLVGGAVGNILATLIGPSWVSWYNTPQDPTANCNCLRIAHDVSSGLIRIQIVGTIIGAVVFLVLGIIISRARSSKTPKPSTTSATPPPGA